MTRLKLTGLVAATHTPFHDDGSLNLDIVAKQAEHLQRNGINTAFIGGSTGESHSLNVDERRQLTTRWMEVTAGTDMKVIVHVGSNCLVDAAALAKHAQQSKACAVAALSPSYFKPRSVEVLVDCAAQVASAAPDTPFYFYDIPVLTGVSLPMPEFLDLGRKAIPNLAGLKFTNPDLMAFQFCLRAGDGSFDVPWGCDEFLLAAVALGATGAVGSTYNFAAPIYHRVLKAFAAGDLDTARSEQFRAVQMIQIIVRYGFIGSTKAIMKMLGVDVGPGRLPNPKMSAEATKSLHADLEKIGFFGWI
ncbi:MAG TPA: dihydrodipicolinate synthase family protein [Schlesneria sp.]|jgi:N-acetylneuraminate lyase